MNFKYTKTCILGIIPRVYLAMEPVETVILNVLGPLSNFGRKGSTYDLSLIGYQVHENPTETICFQISEKLFQKYK